MNEQAASSEPLNITEIERLFSARQAKRLYDALVAAHKNNLSLALLLDSTQSRLLRERHIEVALADDQTEPEYDPSDSALDTCQKALIALSYLALQAPVHHLKIDTTLNRLRAYRSFARRHLHLDTAIGEPGAINHLTEPKLKGYLTICRNEATGDLLLLGTVANPQGELFYCYIPYSGRPTKSLDKIDPEKCGDTTLIPLTPDEAFSAAVHIKTYLDYLDQQLPTP